MSTTDETRGPMSAADDDILDALRRLPAYDLDPVSAERLRRRAQAAFGAEQALARRPWRRRAVRLWSRVLEPALVAGTVGAYLMWAVRAVEVLYR